MFLGSNCEDTMDLLRDAREELNMALNWRVMYPRKPPPESSEEIVDAIADARMTNVKEERTDLVLVLRDKSLSGGPPRRKF